jgi:ent-kaurene oxidase
MIFSLMLQSTLSRLSTLLKSVSKLGRRRTKHLMPLLSTLAGTKVCNHEIIKHHMMNIDALSLEDWTPIAAQPKILELVTQMVARTIVGPDICRDPEWVPALIGYAQNVFMGAVTLKLVPKLAYPLVSWFTPYFYRIQRCRRTIRRLVRPVMEQTLALRKEDPEWWAAKVKSEDMTTLEWLIETSTPEDTTVPKMAHRLTGVSFGAAHTTSNTITNALMDLANDFDRWAPPLREEIENIVGRDSTSLTNADLSKMWKLDSFLKESQRFHPPSKRKLLY